jgi:hypothetical protein
MVILRYKDVKSKVLSQCQLFLSRSCRKSIWEAVTILFLTDSKASVNGKDVSDHQMFMICLELR